MSSRNRTTAARLVIVGGGPRAIAVLERLGASAAQPAHSARLERAPLHVDIVDPHMPGAGRIWRADESPLLLMNSRAADVSIFTDETVDCEGPVRAGPSLAQWADGIRRGTIAAPTVGTERLAEIERLTETDFASRRVQALYLEWFLGQVLAALPATVGVSVHRTTATAVRRAESAEGWLVELEDRPALGADLLLLAAGHTDARPSIARHHLAAFAHRHGGAYLPPSQAGDARLDLLAPGQDVIVRGMGLGFIDLLALLTEGRGGRFEPAPGPGDPGRLTYLPSGHEPHLWVGSRRGVPYHSKVRDEGVPAGPRNLAHVTEENLSAREDAEGRLDVRADVIPLIAAEIARAVPGAPVAGPGEEPLAWLDEPLAWLDGEAEPQVTRDAVVRHIELDLRERTQGDTSAGRALFQVLLRVHGALVDLLPASRLREPSVRDHPRWWHSLFSFVDSGPPPHRLHQLLALERAGVVSFLGPRTVVVADDATGRFHARGGGGVQVSATALVDAFLPEPSLSESTNPLLRDLVADDPRRPAIGRESLAAPGTLDTDARHRVLGPGGAPQPLLWAIGPWTSELPVGAFARPRSNAACHRRNDALARDLLEAALASAQRVDRPRHPGAPSDLPVGSAPRPLRLGVLGPGKIGTALARTALRSGLEVQVAGRSARDVLAARLPGAAPVPFEELGAASDLVLLTVPLHAALGLDPTALQGAIVVDVTNPWGEVDALAVAAARRAAGDEHAELSTSELLAARLPGARVVKTLNHIGYHDVEDQGRPCGHPARRALAVAADDARAADVVSRFLERIGFDAVRVGPLAAGRDLEPGAGLFAGWRTREELLAVQAQPVRAA